MRVTHLISTNSNMKRINAIVLSTLTAAAIMAGCTGNSHQQQTSTESEQGINDIVRDSTIYGICGLGSAMNTLELIIDSGDTLNVSIEEANGEGQVFGGITSGDRMGVLPKNGHKDTARVVINISSLLGEWVMPNPLDGASDMGIRIKEGGIVEGIEQSSVIYKTWKLFNGKLELISQREGGGDEEEAIYYDLLMLSPDTLVIRDSEDTFNYGRIKEEAHKRLIQFEEANEDEFRL